MYSAIDFAATVHRDRVDRVSYLLPNDEQLSVFATEDVHIVREVRLDLRRVGAFYFNWMERPDLPGHPSMLDVRETSGCDLDAPLTWVDLSTDSRWRRICAAEIHDVRLIAEASGERDLSPSLVVIGLQIEVRGMFVQVTVVEPPLAYRTVPLGDLRWTPSSIVSVVFPPFDIAARADTLVVSARNGT